MNNSVLCAISGFHSDQDKICSFLGSYSEHSGKSLPKFRGKLSVLFSEAKIEEGTDRFSRKLGNDLPLHTE